MILIDYQVLVLGFAFGIFLGSFVSLIYHVLAGFCNWIRG